jgi:hypothetical protein
MATLQRIVETQDVRLASMEFTLRRGPQPSPVALANES